MSYMEAQNKHEKFGSFSKTKRIINLLGLEELYSKIGVRELKNGAHEKFENKAQWKYNLSYI